ncbi:hypothetical protein [Pedobacter puniceum]|jgi:hypothetical protein|uniref:DUF1049 domain-containing protein n=1 Tax=Pedobacter puniceum TaxID=2666136 RepID=A0A7K0FJL8_9SPHI|nr:hypothetical protein [Pedobacter puniceum]MRX45992.1 hypothetical protein [Pedobacter puniceum]
MSFKTLTIIILSVLITVVFMQNTDEVLFTILWKEIYVSKLLMMLIVTVFGFILGLIIARPKKKTPLATESARDIPFEVNNPNDDYLNHNDKKGLSDEDRDYIS